MVAAEVVDRYGSPSVVRGLDAGNEVLLATSGGVTEAGPALRPYFFRGFLTDTARQLVQAAQGPAPQRQQAAVQALGAIVARAEAMDEVS